MSGEGTGCDLNPAASVALHPLHSKTREIQSLKQTLENTLMYNLEMARLLHCPVFKIDIKEY